MSDYHQEEEKKKKEKKRTKEKVRFDVTSFQQIGFNWERSPGHNLCFFFFFFPSSPPMGRMVETRVLNMRIRAMFYDFDFVG